MSQTRSRPLPAHLVALLAPVAGVLALAIGCTGGGSFLRAPSSSARRRSGVSPIESESTSPRSGLR